MASRKEEISWIKLNEVIEEEGLDHLIICLRTLVRLRRSKKVFVVEDF